MPLESDADRDRRAPIWRLSMPFRGKRNEPSHARMLAAAIVAVRETDAETIGRATSQNFFSFVSGRAMKPSLLRLLPRAANADRYWRQTSADLFQMINWIDQRLCARHCCVAQSGCGR